MVRTPCYDKNGMKKGTWTPEEDNKLIAYVTRYGSWNWRQLPKFAGLQRCGKSCRLRWLNYLGPNVKRGNYTKEEEAIIMRMHKSLGNRWSVIAAKLPGRTDNEVKNHWHTNLKKQVMQSELNTQTHDHQESTLLECPTSSFSQEAQTEVTEAGPVNAPSSAFNYTMDTPDILQDLTQLVSPDHQPYLSFDVVATPSMEDLLSDDSFGFLEAPRVLSGRILSWVTVLATRLIGFRTHHEMLFAFDA